MGTKFKVAELLVEIGMESKDAERSAKRLDKTLKETTKTVLALESADMKAERALKETTKAREAATKATEKGEVALAAEIKRIKEEKVALDKSKKALDAAKKATQQKAKADLLAKKALLEYIKGIQSFSTRIVSTAKQLTVAAAAITAAAGGVVAFVHNIAKGGEDVTLASQRIGANVKEFQRLKFAASEVGVKMDLFSRSIRNINRNMTDASNGGGRAFMEGLDRLGLSLSELEGISVEERFGLIADALGKVENKALRTRLVMNMLGEEAGPRMTPLLLKGSKGIKEAGDRAEEMGVVMEETALTMSMGFTTAMSDLSAMIQGLKIVIGVELMPQVLLLVESWKVWIKANKSLIAQKVSKFFADIIRMAKRLQPTIEKVAEALVFVATNLDSLIILFLSTRMAAAFTAIIAGLVNMGIASSAALGPIGAIITAMGILIPAAHLAGSALGDFLARDGSVVHKERDKAPSVSTQSSPLRRAASAASSDARAEMEIIRQLKSGGHTDSSSEVQAALERQREAELTRVRLTKEANAEDARVTAEQLPLPDIGPQLPKLGEAPISLPDLVPQPKGRKAGKEKKAAPEGRSRVTMEDLLQRALSGDDLSDITRATPDAASIKPTLAVTITNNNFNLEFNQTIKSVGNAADVGKESYKEFSKNFQAKISQAGLGLAGRALI